MARIVCPKCEFEQEAGIECRRCGIVYERYHAAQARLQMDSSADTPVAGPSPFRRFYRGFRWVMLAVLVVVIFLVLRQSSPPVVESDPLAGPRLESKIRRAERSIQAGQPHLLNLQESELNSWIQKNLALDGPAQRAAAELAPTTPEVEEVQSAMQDIKIDLSGDRVRAYVLFDFHGQQLSLLLEGRLRVQNGQLRFEPTGGKLGSLPLPQTVLDRAVQRLFESPENREKFRLPYQIANIHVENSELVISYR